MSKGLKVFITYAHRNTTAKDMLITYLAVMKQNGLIRVWHDNEILPGDRWRDAIFSNLADSDILLYLTSAYSLASENCNKELAAKLNSKIRVIPIILEHCDWQHHQLSEFQALPDKGKPINEWDPESKGWQNVVNGVRKVVEEMQSRVKPSPRITEEEIEILADLALQRGNFAMMLEQMGEAVATYSRAIELGPNNAAAYNNRGVAYAKNGAFGSAIKNFNKAINLKPNYEKAYSNRGNAYGELLKFGQAITDISRAIDLNPKYATAYCNRGRIHHKKRELDRAMQDLDKATKLDPFLAEAYNNRGAVYLSRRKYSRAIQDFNKAIGLSPKHAEAYNNRGTAFAQRRDFDSAIADFNVAIKYKPRDAQCYSNRGMAHYENGKNDLAIADFTKAVELDPDNIDFRHHLRMAYQRRPD